MAKTLKKQKRFYNTDSDLIERMKDGTERKVGPQLSIIAFGTVEGSQQTFAVLKFRNLDGQTVIKFLPRSEIRTKGSFLDTIVDLGYLAPSDKDKEAALFEYVQNARPKRRWLILRRPGWASGKFALPDQTIGQANDDVQHIFYRPDAGAFSAKFGSSGTLEEWKIYVAGPAGYSTTISFFTCLSLAAPLIGLCNLEGGGVHAVCATSNGKTLGGLVARSVWGEATRSDLVKWRATINALEAVAFAHNDCFLVLDDTSQIPGTKESQALTLREVAYQLPDGQGKLRMGTPGRVRETCELRWRLLFISNGERLLADIVKGGGEERHGGGEVRLADLPIPAHPEFGIFERHPPNLRTFDEIITAIEGACRKYHGTAAPAFLKWVVKKPKATRRLVSELMEKFYQLALISNDKWEHRFGSKFAVAYAAGVLAVRIKILPWNENLVQDAVLACYRRARLAIPEVSHFIARGIATFERNLTDTTKVIDLRNMSRAERKKIVRDLGKGYLRDRPEIGPHLVILPKTFDTWFTRAQESQLVLQELERGERLLRDPTDDKLATRQIKMPWGGSKKRYYVIKLAD